VPKRSRAPSGSGSPRAAVGGRGLPFVANSVVLAAPEWLRGGSATTRRVFQSAPAAMDRAATSDNLAFMDLPRAALTVESGCPMILQPERQLRTTCRD